MRRGRRRGAHPRIPEQRAYMESYTPCTNLPDPADRPPLLVTGAVHDPCVLVHEPAKWVAALRHSDPEQGDRVSIVDRGSVAFRVETVEGSHGGQAGRYAALGAHRARRPLTAPFVDGRLVTPRSVRRTA